MRNILLAIVVAALTASSALAQQSVTQNSGTQNNDKSPPSGRLLPLKRPEAANNSCAAYGPGFVKVEGTSTCVKTSGSVGIGAGGSSGGR
jgi:hypothetical protein